MRPIDGFGRGWLLVVILWLLASGAMATDLAVKHSFRSPGNVQPPDWRLQLTFDRPVSVLDLPRQITLTVNGKPGAIKIINATDLAAEPSAQPLPGERTIFIIGPKTALPSGASCTIFLSKDLPTADKKSRLGTDLRVTFRIGDTARLLAVEPFYDASSDSKGAILRLSSDLLIGDLKAQIRVLPPVGRLKFATRGENDNAFLFEVTGAFTSGKSYTITTRSPRNVSIGTRLEPASFSFVAKGPSPSIQIETDRGVLELRSRQLLPVSVTNVDQVQGEITRLPAMFAPAFADLILFARNDAPRSRRSRRQGPNDDQDAGLAAAIPQIESRLSEFLPMLKALQSLPPLPNRVPLAHFLGEFSTAREVFVQQGRPDKPSRFSLPLNFRPAPDQGGAYLLKLLNGQSEEGSTARVFQITDLSITYKFAADEILFWVTSLETGKPQANVSLMLITKDDRRYVLGRTDANGLLHVKEGASFPVLRLQGSRPEVETGSFRVSDAVFVVAATADDSCFLPLAANRFRPFAVAQAVPGKVSLRSRNAHVFTERGVYKPGETIHWKAALRKYEENEIRAPAGESVRVEIVNSRDDTIFDEECTLNEYGTCSGSFTLKEFAPLGQYTIKVSWRRNPPVVAGKVATEAWSGLVGKLPEPKSRADEEEKDWRELTSTGFQVQFFEPPRHFVEIEHEVKTRQNTTIPERPFTENYLECRIRAKYYTGGFLKHAKTRWTATLVPVTRSLKGYDGFLFGCDQGDRLLIETGESLLDKDGQLVIHLPMDKSLNGGLYGVEISATVLDVDARPATKVETFSPKARYEVGIQRLAHVQQDEEITLQAIALTAEGKPAPAGTMRLDIFRKRHFYTQKRDADGNIYYRWESGWVRAMYTEQPLKDGRASFVVAFADGGEYRLQANLVTPEGEFSASQYLDVGWVYTYSYDDEDEEDSPRRSDSEIMLTASRSPAAVGDTLRFDFGLPRAATHALVTCERDGIYEHRVIPVAGRRGTFEMKVPPAACPNAFFTVTVPCGRGDFPVYRSQVDQMMPRVYYGVAQVRVENTLDTLQVTITEGPGDAGKAPLRAHPGETRSLTFQATNAAKQGVVCEMAVAVVDEAVLSLTGFVTPMLTRLVDFVLPLTVFSGDLRLSVVSQELLRLFATQMLTGGDLGAGGLASDLALRKDFRPVAYWNPALMTDPQGRASITFTLPDSTTAYRIYVVALDKGSAFCSTERQMIVSKEFYLQPGLPRFLTAGDRAVAPVTANNKTDAAASAELTVAEASNISARLRESTVQMGALSNTVAKVELEADNGAGDARLVFQGKMGRFGDAIQSEFPVMPRFIVVRRQKNGHFTDRSETRVEIPAEVGDLSVKDLRGTLKATLGLSTTPWSKITPGLRYLLQYPYGCVEQTSSGIIPLAGLRKLVADGLVPGITLDQVDKFLKPGVTRLLKMQTARGGFGYWMGDRRPSWWGTQYAVFALFSAKEAGFDVPAASLERATTYIREGLFGKEPIDEPVHHSIFELSAVNLARQGELSAANLETLKKNRKSSAIESAALLLWADALVKLTPPARLKEELKGLQPRIHGTRRSWYDSSVREVAICLLAQMAIDPGDRRADDLAGALLDSLQPEGRWFSTADTGWALLALGRYFERRSPPSDRPLEVTVVAGGGAPQTVKIGKLGQEIELDAAALLKDPSVTMSVKPSGMVNWSLSWAYPDPASRTTDLEHGFKIEKTITNLNGEKEIRVGDLVKVTVEFEDDRSGNRWNDRLYEYLALEDPLPAGFIGINAALKTEGPVRPRDDEEEESSGNDEEEWYSSWEEGAYLLRPDFFEMRDDRVLAFCNRLWSGRFRFTYYARAICEGAFYLRPTRVSLMYDPDLYGMTPGRTLHILPAR